MPDYVQYHNPDTMGGPCEDSDDFSVYTNKPYPLVASTPGHPIWLIGGEGRPRSYGLCCVFIADEIGEADHPAFRWYARGAVGRRFHPPLRLDHDPWFGPFLRRMANFSLGLRELLPGDAEQLRRLSGVRALDE